MAREQFSQAADALRAIGATRWLILALAHLVGTIDDPDQAQRIYPKPSLLPRRAATFAGLQSSRAITPSTSSRWGMTNARPS